MRIFFPLLLAFIIIFLPGLSSAQTQQPGQAGSLLPDINPQDIEIRGDFQIRFTGLSRQPILGFNPTPRVFRIDPDRIPYIETADEIVATVSISDLEQALTPESDNFVFPQRRHTFARLGFGQFVSPFASIQHESQLKQNRWLTADVRFHGSAGHTEIPEQSKFYNLNTDISYISYGENGRFYATLGSLVQNNQMVLRQAFSEWSSNDTYSISASTGYTTNKSAYDISSIGFSYRWLHQEREPIEGGFTPGFNFLNETAHIFSLDASRSSAGKRIEEVYQFYSQSDADILPTTDLYRVSGKAGFAYNRRLGTDLTGRFSADLAYAHTAWPDSSKTRLLPLPGLQLTYKGIDHTTIFFDAGSFVNHQSAHNLHQINPYFADFPVTEPEYGYKVQLEIQYKLRDRFIVFSDNRFNIYKNYTHFTLQRSGAPGNTIGLFQFPVFVPYQVRTYDDVWVLTNSVGFWYQFIPDNLAISAQFNLNSGEVTHHSDDETLDFEDSSASVPDLAPYSGQFSVFARPTRNLYLTAWMDYSDQTIRSVANIGHAVNTVIHTNSDAYFLLNLQADYRVSSQFGLYLKGLNLLNQKYETWLGYPERPFQVYGGITVTF